MDARNELQLRQSRLRTSDFRPFVPRTNGLVSRGAPARPPPPHPRFNGVQDVEELIEAVSRDGLLLRFIPPHLLQDPEDRHQVELAAVNQNPFAFGKYFPSRRVHLSRRRHRRRTTPHPVPRHSEHVSAAGKADEEIVSAAVSQRGSLLYYADPSLQNDKRIAKIAVTNG